MSEIYFFGDIYSLLPFILLSSFILVYIFSFTESNIVFYSLHPLFPEKLGHIENGLQFRVIYKLLISVPVTPLNCSLAEAFFVNLSFFSSVVKRNNSLFIKSYKHGKYIGKFWCQGVQCLALRNVQS